MNGRGMADCLALLMIYQLIDRPAFRGISAIYADFLTSSLRVAVFVSTQCQQISHDMNRGEQA
jgi:hypothetical protein